MVGNKTDGRLGTTFPIKLGYQTLLVAFNKAHTTAQERKKKERDGAAGEKTEQTETSHRRDGGRGCP